MRPLTLLTCLVAALIPLASVPQLVVAQETDSITVDRPVIAAEDALAHVGKECTVEYVVASSRTLEGKATCFLNSQKDHRDKSNFTAVIFKAGLDELAAASVADPASEYLDKKVRVGGKITERNGQAQIVIESATQIEVVPGDNADK